MGGAARPQGEHASRLLLSLAYSANLTTSYLLMLAVMTFNVGYFITVVSGLTIGHFFLFPAPLDEALASGSLLSELCCAQPSS